MANYLCVVVFAQLLALALAVPFQDKINNLPFYKGNGLGVQYSGYITVDAAAGKQLHYWFIESKGNPYNDPLILWLNGGPGCSSLDGLFYEQGPFHFDANEDPLDLALVDNPWTWVSRANMIFLEAPAGVGFSLTNQWTTNDNITADNNHQFLKNWFQAFPEFKQNDFYIAGESYAGIYVPTLAYRVSQDKSINFKGMMVGNGVTDATYDDLYHATLPFLYGHGVYSSVTQDQIDQYCFGTTQNKTRCQQALNDVMDNMAAVDIYDIYSDCYHQRPNAVHNDFLKALKERRQKKVGGAVVPPCIDANKATQYLNLVEVQDEIHVKTGVSWSICTDSINYNEVVSTVIPIYQYLIQQGKYKILVYSGDTDGAVPFTGTEAWIRSLNLPVKSLWKEWYIETNNGKQVAGYVSAYNGLTFVTVRGSGHMVPQFKPEAAFFMFQRFIDNQPINS